MNESELERSPALAAYAAELRGATPGTALDARVGSAIDAIVPGHARRRRNRIIHVSIAAGLVAIVLVTSLLLGTRDERSPVPQQAAHDEAAPDIAPRTAQSLEIVPAGPYSPWPSDAAIFRLRTSLDATSAALLPDARPGERQFWVDVRVANDGTMRVVRIVPAEGAASASVDW